MHCEDSFFGKKGSMYSSKRKLLVNYNKVLLLSIEKYSNKWYICIINTFVFSDPSYHS